MIQGYRTRTQTAEQTPFDGESDYISAENTKEAIVETFNNTHSWANINERRVIVTLAQQMVVYQEIKIKTDGDLDLRGELIVI